MRIEIGQRELPMPQYEEYIRFQSAKEALRQAQDLKASGNLEGAFDKLCVALNRVISDTDDNLEDFDNRLHDLDGRVG